MNGSETDDGDGRDSLDRAEIPAMNDTETGGTTEDYIRYAGRKRLFLLALVLVMIAVSVFTIRLGSTDLSYTEILKILTGTSSEEDGGWKKHVVLELRLPIVVAAIIVGASLGVAGAAMQSILRNPLASPFTLGLSNAAAFGASVGIMATTGAATGWVSGSGPLVMVVLAFTFAMVAAFIVIALMRFTDTAPETIVLAGLAISAVFSSGLAFLQYMADDVQLSSIVFWQFGSLDKIKWRELYLIVAAFIVAAAYFMFRGFDYNVMEAGDDTAASLGVDVPGIRMMGLAVAAMVTAVAVSFAGIIGFVGLLAPHAVRSVTGGDNRYLLPGSMLVGALVLLIANVLSQHAFGVVVPIGIITSAVGGPVFLYILVRRKRNA